MGIADGCTHNTQIQPQLIVGSHRYFCTITLNSVLTIGGGFKK